MEFTWSDQMETRGRHPHLFVKLPGQSWQEFVGKPIPGVLAVLSAQHVKCGKWSHTKFVLAVKSAIVVQLLTPFDGWGATWADHKAGITVLVGEYDRELAARELMPLVESQTYRDAVARAVAAEDNVLL